VAGPETVSGCPTESAEWTRGPAPKCARTCGTLGCSGDHARASDSEVDKTVALEFGADYHVTKPFSWRELDARIQAILHRREQD
jgi:hypothetical protein